MDRARYHGTKCLMRIENSGYSNLTLKQVLSGVEDQQEAAFCTALVYGTVSRLRTLDWFLSRFCKTPLEKLDPEIRAILRSGAYQLMYMDKVPKHSAVDESVKLAYSFKKKSASGMVNAVLRKIADIDPNSISVDTNTVQGLAVRYSVSDDVAQLLVSQYGIKDTQSILSSTLEPQQPYVYINPLMGSTEEVIRLLEEEEQSPKLTFVEDVYSVDNGRFVMGELFSSGRISPMGLWSAAAASAVEAREGERVLDCCAAPGGKSMYMAGKMKGLGTIVSCDVNPTRLPLISDNAKRCGVKNIRPTLADATVFSESFANCHRVLCDVPCSGLGMMGTKPEIRYKKKSDFEKLPQLQGKILANCARYVRPGGRLVYSTCTINKEENEAVVQSFLENNRDFKVIIPQVFVNKLLILDKFALNLPLTPGESGFFVATFERTW